MENDSIRASGSNTLVDIWIEGKVRAICVTQAAIGATIGFDQAAAMTEEGRCDFVRRNLAQIVKGAKAALRRGDPNATSVTVDEAQLADPGAARGDRRRKERRTGDRRKADRPVATLGHGERRRGERRKTDRRSKPKEER
jgi:hypothetical protein